MTAKARRPCLSVQLHPVLNRSWPAGLWETAQADQVQTPMTSDCPVQSGDLSLMPRQQAAQYSTDKATFPSLPVRTR